MRDNILRHAVPFRAAADEDWYEVNRETSEQLRACQAELRAAKERVVALEAGEDWYEKFLECQAELQGKALAAAGPSAAGLDPIGWTLHAAQHDGHVQRSKDSFRTWEAFCAAFDEAPTTWRLYEMHDPRDPETAYFIAIHEETVGTDGVFVYPATKLTILGETSYTLSSVCWVRLIALLAIGGVSEKYAERGGAKWWPRRALMQPALTKRGPSPTSTAGSSKRARSE